MNKIILSILCLSITIVFGCSRSTSNPFVGKWKLDGDVEMIYEIRNDGTYVIDGRVDNFRIEDGGNWMILEDGKVQLIEERKKPKRISVYTVKGDTLYPDGGTHKLTRIK